MAAVMLFMAFAIPMQSSASIKSTTPIDSTTNAQMLSTILNRVTEIQNMDKTNLTISEKRELKKELKEMKAKAEGLDKRIYLSVGAVIIIILLLILIL